MFLLSVIDVLVLPCNAIISGIQEVLGLHYCTNPTLFYIAGTIGTGKAGKQHNRTKKRMDMGKITVRTG